MKQTVKEIVEEAISCELLDEKNQNTPKTIIMSEIYRKTLKNVLQAHENELAEKDKEHKEQLKRMYEQFKHDKELEINQYKFETEQQRLYKEDFDLTCYAECNCNGEGCGYGLIDNSDYEKLDSKDVK